MGALASDRRPRWQGMTSFLKLPFTGGLITSHSRLRDHSGGSILEHTPLFKWSEKPKVLQVQVMPQRLKGT